MSPPKREARRRPEALRAALTEDASSKIYRYLWTPLLLVQLALYTRVVIRFVSAPVYRAVPSADYPLLHENHIGNLVSIRSQPSLVLLGIHVAMAWSWIFVVLLQKHLVSRMSRALSTPDAPDAPDAPHARAPFSRYRTAHAIAGTLMVLLGLAGVLVAPIIALADHGNPPMARFLLGQPLFFVPAIVMVAVTARDKNRSIRHHRFWSDVAFLGPAIASVWTEAGIYVLGRLTPVGPNQGELWASVVGGALGALAVVIPGWISLRKGLAADAAASAGSDPVRELDSPRVLASPSTIGR
ncbi:MAG: hypothetical protein U0359_05935 [Byssovorax sp.]